MVARLRDYLGTALLFVGGTVLGLVICKAVLTLFDPTTRLPRDGHLNGTRYTWGHEVINNDLGFREREVPKDLSVFRVMALGDSLTWGAGLALRERYTALAEEKLNVMLPSQRVEVHNFGRPTLSTVEEASLLKILGERIKPDLIVIGFCLNDLQPRGQNWSAEREEFIEALGGYSDFTRGLAFLGLKRCASLMEEGALAIAEWGGVIPDWTTSLGRSYQEDSPEWRAFSAALADIAAYAFEKTARPPIFLVLNSTLVNNGTAADYIENRQHIIHDWNNLAQKEASKLGFVTANVRDRIEALPGGISLVVNAADGHPSAALNVLYGDRLAELVLTSLSEDPKSRFKSS